MRPIFVSTHSFTFLNIKKFSLINSSFSIIHKTHKSSKMENEPTIENLNDIAVEQDRESRFLRTGIPSSLISTGDAKGKASSSPAAPPPSPMIEPLASGIEVKDIQVTLSENARKVTKNLNNGASLDLNRRRKLLKLAQVKAREIELRFEIDATTDAQIKLTESNIEDEEKKKKEIAKLEKKRAVKHAKAEKTTKADLLIIMKDMNKIKIGGADPDGKIKSKKAREELRERTRLHDEKLDKARMEEAERRQQEEDAAIKIFIESYEKRQEHRHWAHLKAKFPEVFKEGTKEDIDLFKSEHPYRSDKEKVTAEFYDVMFKTNEEYCNKDMQGKKVFKFFYEQEQESEYFALQEEGRREYFKEYLDIKDLDKETIDAYIESEIKKYKEEHPYVSEASKHAYRHYRQLYRDQPKSTLPTAELEKEDIIDFNELTPQEKRDALNRNAKYRVKMDKFAEELQEKELEEMDENKRAIQVLIANDLTLDRKTFELDILHDGMIAAATKLKNKRIRRLLDLKIQIYEHIVSFQNLAIKVWTDGAWDDKKVAMLVKPEEPFIMELHFNTESYVKSQTSMVSSNIVYKTRAEVHASFVANALRVQRRKISNNPDKGYKALTYEQMDTYLTNYVASCPPWCPGRSTTPYHKDEYDCRMYQQQMFYLDNWKGPMAESTYITLQANTKKDKKKEKEEEQTGADVAIAASSLTPVTPPPPPTPKSELEYEYVEIKKIVIPIHYIIDFDLITKEEQDRKIKKSGSDLEFIQVYHGIDPLSMDKQRNGTDELKKLNIKPIELTDQCCVCIGFIYQEHRKKRSYNNRVTVCNLCAEKDMTLHCCSDQCADEHDKLLHTEKHEKKKLKKILLKSKKRERKIKKKEKTDKRKLEMKQAVLGEKASPVDEIKEEQEEEEESESSESDDDGEEKEESDINKVNRAAIQSKLKEGDIVYKLDSNDPTIQYKIVMNSGWHQARPQLQQFDRNGNQFDVHDDDISNLYPVPEKMIIKPEQEEAVSKEVCVMTPSSYRGSTPEEKKKLREHSAKSAIEFEKRQKAEVDAFVAKMIEEHKDHNCTTRCFYDKRPGFTAAISFVHRDNEFKVCKSIDIPNSIKQFTFELSSIIRRGLGIPFKLQFAMLNPEQAFKVGDLVKLDPESNDPETYRIISFSADNSEATIARHRFLQTHGLYPAVYPVSKLKFDEKGMFIRKIQCFLRVDDKVFCMSDAQSGIWTIRSFKEDKKTVILNHTEHYSAKDWPIADLYPVDAWDRDAMEFTHIRYQTDSMADLFPFSTQEDSKFIPKCPFFERFIPNNAFTNYFGVDATKDCIKTEVLSASSELKKENRETPDIKKELTNSDILKQIIPQFKEWILSLNIAMPFTSRVSQYSSGYNFNLMVRFFNSDNICIKQSAYALISKLTPVEMAQVRDELKESVATLRAASSSSIFSSVVPSSSSSPENINKTESLQTITVGDKVFTLSDTVKLDTNSYRLHQGFGTIVELSNLNAHVIGLDGNGGWYDLNELTVVDKNYIPPYPVASHSLDAFVQMQFTEDNKPVQA